MKLDHVVRTYKGNQGDPTMHGYIKILHHMVQGLKSLNVNMGYDIITEKIDIDAKKQGVLPDDYIQWSSVTVLAGDRLIKMVHDHTIIGPEFSERQPYSNEILEPIIDNEFDYLVSRVSPDNVIEELGSGVGYFNIDAKAGIIQFDARLDLDHAYLKYISNTFRPNTETEVHPFVAKCLVEYAKWQEKRWDKRYGDAHSETFASKQEYLQMVDEAVGNIMNLSTELFVDIQNRSYSRVPIRNN